MDSGSGKKAAGSGSGEDMASLASGSCKDVEAVAAVRRGEERRRKGEERRGEEERKRGGCNGAFPARHSLPKALTTPLSMSTSIVDSTMCPCT